MKKKGIVVFVGLLVLAATVVLWPGAEAEAQSAAQLLINRYSKKCLDIRGSSATPRALAQQYTCKGSSNQLWQLVPVGNGYYNLIALHSGQCLDVRGASTKVRATVQQYPCNGKSNQQWALAPSNSGGYFLLVARHSGMCLDVKSKSKSDRAPVQQYPCHGGKNQRWALQ